MGGSTTYFSSHPAACTAPPITITTGHPATAPSTTAHAHMHAHSHVRMATHGLCPTACTACGSPLSRRCVYGPGTTNGPMGLFSVDPTSPAYVWKWLEVGDRLRLHAVVDATISFLCSTAPAHSIASLPGIFTSSVHGGTSHGGNADSAAGDASLGSNAGQQHHAPTAHQMAPAAPNQASEPNSPAVQRTGSGSSTAAAAAAATASSLGPAGADGTLLQRLSASTLAALVGRLVGE